MHCGHGLKETRQIPPQVLLTGLLSTAARGAEQEGAKPGSGVQRFWGPLGASEFDPSFQKFGVSGTPSQRPLRAQERLSGPRGRLFRGLGEGCPFSTERENKVGHSEASKRPRFPGCPLRGFQPSGSYPQATDNFGVKDESTKFQKSTLEQKHPLTRLKKK